MRLRIIRHRHFVVTVHDQCSSSWNPMRNVGVDLAVSIGRRNTLSEYLARFHPLERLSRPGYETTSTDE